MAEKKTKHLSFRLNILFLITFLLFSALIFRLGIVQIVEGEEYLLQTEKNTVRSIQVAAPRGLMMDRHGELLVDNVPSYTVTYTENPGLRQNLELTAERLSELIDMDADSIISKVDSEARFAPQRIKQNLTDEEMFRISERLDELPGVGVMLDADRNYVQGSLFSSFIGSVGQIHAENWNYYRAKGYAMNDIVGRSLLEAQYEEQLRGTASETEIYVDRALRPIGDPMHTPGKRGNDLMLTIDIGFQKHIEDVIDRMIEENDFIADDNIVEQPHFVAMDPNTGEILGMSNNVYTYSHGQYDAGSTVKMASVLMGLHEGIYQPNTTIIDRTMEIGGDRFRISSWRNLGSINAYSAIQRSSNIYVAQIGLRLAGSSGPGWSLGASSTRVGFDKVRQYNAQFGLGGKTGIDLPNESPGRIFETENPGDLAQNMFGQHDQYTPLQLAQYVSTIANGGYRIQPHLVKEIRRGVPSEDGISQVVWKKKPQILNRIDMSDEHLEVIQEGMRMVTQTSGGTAQGQFRSFPVEVAAKTGTAQTNRNFNHTLLVGYAPADNPQIAFASLVPYSQRSQAESGPSAAQLIAKEILEYYFVHEADIDEETIEEIEERHENEQNEQDVEGMGQE